MDAQLKRGTLDVCVLASLLSGPSYGYKIIKDLNGVIDISESTLYPILRRLETNKLVTSFSEEHNGRLRKMYLITNSGKDKIKDYLVDFVQLMKVYNFISKGVNNER